MALKIPAKINAGDTLSFSDSVSGYPASSGWALKYVFVNASEKQEIESSADGDSHVFSIAPAITVKWKQGKYTWSAFVTNGADRFTIESGKLEIIPDLVAGPSDQRSHVEKTLDALEAAIEKSATNDQLSFSIAGRSVARYTLEEKLKLRDKYRAELIILNRKERVVNGQASGAKVLVRF